jgi:hypothetical protein
MERGRTPWRKSRTYGDIHGGRMSRRMTDNIFRRLHSLAPPGPHDPKPILLVENPSRDFVFPASPAEVAEQLRRLPPKDVEGITHLWFPPVNEKQLQAGLPLAEFICGSGVRVIVIHPWRADLTMNFGAKRPTGSIARQYERWTSDFRQSDGSWKLVWEPDTARDFVLNSLLLHEVGHHVDWYRNHWSAANGRTAEHRAETYAACWMANRAAPITSL